MSNANPALSSSPSPASLSPTTGNSSGLGPASETSDGGWFSYNNRRDRIFRRRFASAIVIQQRNGAVSADQADRYLEALEDPFVVRRLRCRCEFIAGSVAEAPGWFDTLVQWLIANWPQILQILMGLLMFLGDDEN